MPIKRFSGSDRNYARRIGVTAPEVQYIDARVWMVDYEKVDNVVDRPSTATWIVQFEERPMHEVVDEGRSKYRVVAVHRWVIGRWAISNWDSAPTQHIMRMVKQGALTPGFDKTVRLRLT